MGRLRRLLIALAWLAIAVVVAVGAAGIATSLNHPPDNGARPELTWAGDQQAAGPLDAATAKLQALSDAVDALGASSKQALTSLVAGDTDALTSTLDTGNKQLVAVSGAADALRAALAAVPYTDPDSALRVSSATLDRYQQLIATPGLTANLEADWSVLSARAMAASVVPGLLAKHDQQTAAAAKQGEAGHYAAALALLAAPDATLAQARQLRDSLAQNADVTTLSAWIDRHAAYDAALRQLYQAMLAAKGKVTNAVRAAFAAEEAAKAQLPTDTRAIIVIMGDIARGGLNQVAIDIEEARGSLAAALAAQQPQPGPSAAPVESPSPVPSAPESGGASAAPGGSGPATTSSPTPRPVVPSGPDVTPPP